MEISIKMLAEPDVILHNVRFARFDELNRHFVFIGDTAEQTVWVSQERVKAISWVKEGDEK